jgi:hypothetical protein
MNRALIAITLHNSIGDQVGVESGTGRSWIAFQPHPSDTHVLAVQSRVINPRPKAFVMSQRVANLQPKLAGVRIDEARCYTSIATVPMYEVQIRFSHLPRLLNPALLCTPLLTMAAGWYPCRSIVNGSLLPSRRVTSINRRDELRLTRFLAELFPFRGEDLRKGQIADYTTGTQRDRRRDEIILLFYPL